VVGGGSQRLLSLNPTTVIVVLLLGLWLLLGCDNNPTTVMVVLLLGLWLLLGCDNRSKNPDATAFMQYHKFITEFTFTILKPFYC